MNQLALKVIALDPRLEKSFWHHVFQNVFEYYFFIQDLKLDREETEILLALKNEKIDGMTVVYRQSTVQLRGSLEAAEALIDRLDLEKASIMAPKEHKQIILRKYEPLKTREILRMTLQRNDARLSIKHLAEKLGLSDAEEIADLLRKASPVWVDTTTEKLAVGMRRGQRWIGIRRNGKIVSVGSTTLMEFVSNISVVATHKAYMNRGYATSIVLTLVKEILRKSEYALIHVENNNAPALHVYSKVGFKPYKTYLVIEGELKD